MGFTQRLKELRDENHLSQADLAEILDVHFMTISRWERGINSPSIRDIVNMVDLFEISSDIPFPVACFAWPQRPMCAAPTMQARRWGCRWGYCFVRPRAFRKSFATLSPF